MNRSADAKPPRQMFAIRVAPAGIDALQRIAAERKKAGRRDHRVSDVARDALAEYAAQHDPQQRRGSDPAPTKATRSTHDAAPLRREP